MDKEQAIDLLDNLIGMIEDNQDNDYDTAFRMAIEALKQPEIVRCGECKHWKDSDGVYRRGIDAESKCPVNSRQVYEGTFFCGMAERRTDGQE